MLSHDEIANKEDFQYWRPPLLSPVEFSLARYRLATATSLDL